MSRNEPRKISSENVAKRQKNVIFDFEDTDESDTEGSEMGRYIALKPGILKNNDGNQIDILKWWHAHKAKFPSMS